MAAPTSSWEFSSSLPLSAATLSLLGVKDKHNSLSVFLSPTQRVQGRALLWK